MKKIQLYGDTALALETLRMVLEVQTQRVVMIAQLDIKTNKPRAFSVDGSTVDIKKINLDGCVQVSNESHLRWMRSTTTIAEHKNITFVLRVELHLEKLGDGILAKAEYWGKPTMSGFNLPNIVAMDDLSCPGRIVVGSNRNNIQTARPQGFGSNLAQFSILKGTPHGQCYHCRQPLPIMNMEEAKAGDRSILICKDYGCRARAATGS